MKRLLVTLVALALLMGGCSILSQGKFVTEEDKPSPFIPRPDPYEIPRDPTMDR